MAGIAESLVGQIQQAGQPRIAKSTTTVTGKEAPNIGMLGLLLALMLEGEKTKELEPAIPPDAFGPVGGTITPTDTPLLPPGNPLESIMGLLGATAPQTTAPTPSAPKTTTKPVQNTLPAGGTLNMEDILSQLSELTTTAPQANTPASGMTLQDFLDLIIPQTAMPPVVPSIWGPSWRK